MEPLRTLSPCRSMSPLAPRSLSGSRLKTNYVLESSRSGRENTPPNHPNVQIKRSSPVPKKTLKQIAVPPEGENTSLAVYKDGSASPSDDSVRVVVRIRPDHEKGVHQIVQRTASDTLLVGDRTYSFDSIIDAGSSQEDVFNLIGVPLVKNSLAGFNNSIICYGQSGTGKTYTMWGPPSAMVDGPGINSPQGIVPRIFQMLFAEIIIKEESSKEVQTNYQFRCSFLEIYNEQINDLLDPNLRNLRIRNDAKNAFQVENLSEEYVKTIEDVTQLLVKGLSNRKVGATSVNSKSSRSHIMFTCVIESWCKGLSSNFFSSSKTSRISFVDLAGIGNYNLDGCSRQSIQEEQFIKQSLSKLGRLINILSDSTNLENDEKVPHVGSCLTAALQDTLGGNAKTTFICAIFSDERYKAVTLSTLRFGGRAKQVRNKAMINEITVDDVNDLSDQIRQLKEELIRAKSCESNFVSTDGYFKRHNTRESLNHLRRSLNRSLFLPLVDNVPEVEMDVDEEDVRELWVQLNELHSSVEEQPKHLTTKNPSEYMVDAELDSSVNQSSITDPEPVVCLSSRKKNELKEERSEEQEFKKLNTLGIVLVENNQIQCSKSITVPEPEIFPSSGNNESKIECFVAPEIEKPNTSSDNDQTEYYSESSNLCKQLPQFEEPAFCASPKVDNGLKKISSELNNASESPKFSFPEKEYVNKADSICSSMQSSKVSPIDSLAASLHRGLQIIEYHQQNSATNKSTVSLSFEHLSLISCQADMKKVQKDADASFLCSACQKQVTVNLRHSVGMQIIPVKNCEPAFTDSNQDVLEGGFDASEVARQRNTQLEVLCAEQAVKIKDLDTQIDHFKRLYKLSSSPEPNPSVTMLSSKTEEKDSCSAIENEKREDITDHGISLGCSEKEALLDEIQCLRTQLKSYTCSSTNVSLLEQIRNGSTREKREDFESEKERWMESESRWISLTEELRMDLEANRRLAEKKGIELSLEKQCTAELDDALHRSIQGHARMIEHYAELQDNYAVLLAKHRKIMEGIAEVKKAAEIAGSKRKGSAFAAALAAELATSRVEREKERTYLKDQNRVLKLQLRDTAEAVHAAGELLVRLKEAEEAVLVTEEKYGQAQQETERLRRQIEKLKKKHAMEVATMKHCIAGSRLPESALEPLYQQHAFESIDQSRPPLADDMSWRSAFRSEI